MNKKLRKPYILLVTLAMVFTVLMAFTACNDEDQNPNGTAAPSPSLTEGNDVVLEVTGPTELKAGEKVTYTISLKECTQAEGLSGIDFDFVYNTDLLIFDSQKLVKSPSENWESLNREDQEGVLTFACLDGTFSGYSTAKAGEVVIEVTFTVTDKTTSENDVLVKLQEVSGTVEAEEVFAVYGRGNEIKKA